MQKAKLGVLAMGMGLGLTWATGVFILGLMVWFSHWGDLMMHSLASIYVGFGPSLMGSLWGALWAFADGFIAGMLIAFFYNLFIGKQQ